MDDQLEGFEFVKIQYGRRFYAYNTKSNYIVFWLGSEENEDLMKTRITEVYHAPSYVVAKSFTRQEALKYYVKAKKANDKAMMEELEATKGRPVPDYDPMWLRFK